MMVEEGRIENTVALCVSAGRSESYVLPCLDPASFTVDL
jgi:hypothetical protein